MKNYPSTKKLVLAALGLCVFGISVVASASPWLEDRPITVGHRGTTVLADENTIAAFTAAWRRGLDVFECDPRLTSDGAYVIMHDASVDRTTDGTGPVAEMTLAEVKELRTHSGHMVPTLEEALAFAREHGMGVYLDLKVPPKDGAALLTKVIADAGMTDRVIAGCYEKKTCRMVEAAEPAISTCVAWPWPALTFGMAKRLDADAVGTLKQLAGKWAIKRAHKKGIKVITMPLNDPAEIEKFKARGVDGVQTDDPRLVEKRYTIQE